MVVGGERVLALSEFPYITCDSELFTVCFLLPYNEVENSFFTTWGVHYSRENVHIKCSGVKAFLTRVKVFEFRIAF